MKILITGSTLRQCGAFKERTAKVDKIVDTNYIYYALKDMNHEVDYREIVFGEDLEMYDLVIVGMGSFGSFATPNILKALYAIEMSNKTLLFYEDWKIKDVTRSFQNQINKDCIKEEVNKRCSGGSSFFYKDAGHVCQNKEEDFYLSVFTKAIRDVLIGKYDILIPGFEWGDKTIYNDYVNYKRLFTIDLTPFVINQYHIKEVDLVDKKQRHMLASLGDHRAWVKRLKLKNEVDYYGTNKNFETLKTEKDVFDKCNEYDSILCPEYYHAGSGHFRSRWIYAALSNSVVTTTTNSKDFKALGIQQLNIEELSPNQTLIYKNHFKEVIKHWITDEDFFCDKIDKIVKLI